MNRIDRLMALTLYLQGRRVSRAEDMAAHFEISLRTVYRDIAALSEAGVPIVAEAGVGYSLMRGFHVPPVMFTPEEAGALATAAVLVRQLTDDSMSSSMQSALLKIRAVLPADEQQHLDRVERSTQLSERPSKTYKASILDLQTALAERRIVQLSYRTGGSKESTLREVEPIGLVHYLDHWHFVGWCLLRDDVRDFRLDRIVDLKLTGRHYIPREGVTLQSVIECDQAQPTVQAVIQFDSSVADRARRQWALGIVDDQPNAQGAQITIATGSLDWLVGWLLSFQSRATIIDPPELRQKMMVALKEMQQRLAAQASRLTE